MPALRTRGGRLLGGSARSPSCRRSRNRAGRSRGYGARGGQPRGARGDGGWHGATALLRRARPRPTRRRRASPRVPLAKRSPTSSSSNSVGARSVRTRQASGRQQEPSWIAPRRAAPRGRRRRRPVREGSASFRATSSFETATPNFKSARWSALNGRSNRSFMWWDAVPRPSVCSPPRQLRLARQISTAPPGCCPVPMPPCRCR